MELKEENIGSGDLNALHMNNALTNGCWNSQELKSLKAKTDMHCTHDCSANLRMNTEITEYVEPRNLNHDGQSEFINWIGGIRQKQHCAVESTCLRLRLLKRALR